MALRDNGTVYYLSSDHLGSTSLTLTSGGAKYAELRYKAWGEVRYAWGTTPTKYTFTGQYSYTADFGLMDYGARFYDPALGRFTSPDSIILAPYNSQNYDRYSYAKNNPVNLIDPSGHSYCLPEDRDCVLEEKGTLGMFKNLIKKEYGVTLKDGSRAWDLQNAKIVYQGLGDTYSPLFSTQSVTFTLNNNPGLFLGIPHLPILILTQAQPSLFTIFIMSMAIY